MQIMPDDSSNSDNSEETHAQGRSDDEEITGAANKPFQQPNPISDEEITSAADKPYREPNPISDENGAGTANAPAESSDGIGRDTLFTELGDPGAYLHCGGCGEDHAAGYFSTKLEEYRVLHFTMSKISFRHEQGSPVKAWWCPHYSAAELQREHGSENERVRAAVIRRHGGDAAPGVQIL
ncbi:hypothetical protein B0T26DRAFT_745237 [Lasiosphaeria miniovina]|uniref:Uncharacterized protein n=1 Tax=Lasiosphaeria miniovina TaxID=1954250 RepID=A0AA40BF83_9PEZI|nr:uncharacterized protein B0T26DRAFT_745237 [Lasiosphaeria miniovina]KAK0733156.1 hypothetical protein B0T26DRAFT_745237 [Lasiosphaeria miniovina]